MCLFTWQKNIFFPLSVTNYKKKYQKCTNIDDQIHWVPVQDKGSKILCVKLGAMKVTPSDPKGAAWDRECWRRSSVLPLNLLDITAISQDGSYLEFIAPIAALQFQGLVAMSYIH